MMNRRGFLGSMLALCAAPAIVRASSLMKIAPGFEELESGIVVPGNQLLTIEMITNEALRMFMVQHAALNARVKGNRITFDRPIQIGDTFSIAGVYGGVR